MGKRSDGKSASRRKKASFLLSCRLKTGPAGQPTPWEQSADFLYRHYRLNKLTRQLRRDFMRKSFLFLVFVAALSVPAGAAQPDSGKSREAIEALRKALAVQPDSLAGLPEKDFATVPLTRADDAVARELIWKCHAAIIRKDRAQEVTDRVLKDGKLAMPFFFKTFGKKPAAGHSLWISMHGGGEAPKRVNDSQYENQKRLYTLEEGIYLAPRAPTDNWNLWHEPHIDKFFGRLIEDLIVLEGVNPDRVYIMGYSAGGDGVYAMAPRMADRWAAAAMMAGHPNGGSLLSVRNVPIALQCGGNDAAYHRNEVTKEYGEKLDEYRKADPKGYEHFVKIYEGKPHWMNLEDKVALPWMAKFCATRSPTESSGSRRRLRMTGLTGSPSRRERGWWARW